MKNKRTNESEEFQSASFQSTDFTHVHRENLLIIMPIITMLIQKASFIAIDTEFSGLARVKQTRRDNINDRYSTAKENVENFGLLALGMSIFIKTRKTYKSYNFNFQLLSQQSKSQWIFN